MLRNDRRIGILPHLLLFLALVGCADPQDRRELPSIEQVQVYTGTWEYRYGDSPRRSDGSLEWAAPAHDDGQWRTAQKTMNPPGREGKNHLWLRTRLLGPALADPALALPFVNQSFEAYYNGRLLVHFGQVEGPRASRFPGTRPHFLPLGSDYRGRVLTLRIYSPYGSIGVPTQHQLGERAELVTAMVQRGLPLILMGAIFMVIGLALFVVFAIQGFRAKNLLFSCASLTIGLYILSRCAMRSFVFEEPSLWYHIELGSLCLAAASTAALSSSILGRGPLGVLDGLARLFVGYFIAVSVLLMLGKVHIGFVLFPLQCLAIGWVIGIALTAVMEIWRGSTDARIFGLGLVASAAIILYELLRSLESGDRVAFAGHYAAVVFMASLGFVLARRLRVFNKRLQDYSTVLQLSFSAAQDLTPGQQAQVALAELLRMLGAERALIFLCSPESSELALVAGRDAQGNVMLDPAATPVYDQKLIRGVQSKRRPMVDDFRIAPASEGSSPQRRSVIASPMMARGQLLGILYLEADPARHVFGQEDVEILLGLGSQVALTLMATRAGKLESESAQAKQRLLEQGDLLAAAARMAHGDLQSGITVLESSELAPLAQALDSMRKDLLAKIRLLESSNAAVQQLNDELRFQINQRLRRVIDFTQSTSPTESATDSPRKGAAGLAPGEPLSDHYLVVRLLGEGSSGSVYEVERVDGRHLAAKVFRWRADQTVSQRFAQEAEILARLSHPNVVAISDVDITMSGLLFLVMELVRGQPLHHCQERYGDPVFALSVLRQIAAGLCAVHQRNIVHRDLKPANVLIAGDAAHPLVKLVDFGISMASISQQDAPSGSDPQPGQSSVSGMLIGTPMYLAPELAAGSSHASPASDIFSFGIIAYELLTAEMPFAQPPVVSSWRGEVLNIPPLRSKCPNLPEPFVELLVRCLAANPALRPTIAQVLAELDALPR